MGTFKNLGLEGWFAFGIVFLLVAAVIITNVLSWILELVGKIKHRNNKTQ
jgi:hypothetical protein